MLVEGEQSEAVMGVIYRSLAMLAKTTGVPVILICQLNRTQYTGGIPKINHIRYSGMAEMMSSLILLLYNPLTYPTADVISTYLYRVGLEANNFSYAAAIGMLRARDGYSTSVGALIAPNVRPGSTTWGGRLLTISKSRSRAGLLPGGSGLVAKSASTVWLLDDDPSVLKADGRLPASAGWEVERFIDPDCPQMIHSCPAWVYKSKSNS